MYTKHYPLYFLVPVVVLYFVFFILPSLLGIGYSFTDWSTYSDEINYVGLDNFRQIFSPDENYLAYIGNTLIFTGVTIILKTVIGLGLAILLSEGVRRFANFYRLAIYLPAVLPTLVVALIFRSILHPATGALNTFLTSIGLDGLALPWLIDPAIALYSVIGVDTWKGVGYITVILLAGLQTIPRDYYEAAEIDGAGFWARLRYVTIPMLMPAIVVITVLNVLYGLRVFDIVYALTNGGPGYATEVIYTEIFKAFSQGQYGLGTALSTVMFVVLLVAGYFVIRLLERSASQELPRVRVSPMKAAVGHTAAVLTSMAMAFPVYLVVVNAMKTKVQAAAMGVELPTSVEWANFATVIDKGKLVTSFLNSMLYATSSTILGTLAAAMAAFVLSRARTPVRRFLYFFIILGIALPINFVTLTAIMQATHLINTKFGIIVLYAATQIPFAVFLIYGFIASIPRELDEAAIIDGCSPLQLFFIVILPLLKPVLVTAAILNFLGVWGDFLFPLYYLNSSAHWPMTLAIYNFFGQYQQSWNLVSADILLTIIPVLVVYLLGQRFILSGLTSGSVKG